MADEITQNPAPVEAPSEIAVETPQIDAPVVVAPEPTPTTPEPQTAQLGGNEPFEPAPAIETPATMPAPAQEETPAPETPEVPLTETTQPTPTEPAIETVPEPTAVEASTPAQTQTEAPLVAQVETPIPEPTPVSVPVIQTPTPAPAQVIASVVAPVVDLNSPRLGASGEASATRIEASPQAPLAENINSQTFTKSIRELFTKAQLAIQNRKRKKIDRVLTLFAKQTMITNNEVEKLLHVSDATATRYLSTLEKEGKIKQNKKTGKGVSYSKI